MTQEKCNRFKRVLLAVGDAFELALFVVALIFEPYRGFRKPNKYERS